MNTRDFIVLLLVSILWGGSFFFIRLLVLDGLEPLQIVSIRMQLAALFILPFFLNKLKKYSFYDHGFSFILIGILNTALPFTLFSFASLKLGAGSLSILQATVPILTALLLFSLYRNELSIQKIGGVFLGFAGLFVLVGPTGSLDTFSGILCIIASISYAVSGIYLSKTSNKISNSFVGMGAILVGAIIMLPFVLIYLPMLENISLSSWLYLLTLGIVNTAAAFVIFIGLIKRIGPINASYVTYFVPLSSISLGIIFLDEVISITLLIGALMILSGVFLSNKQEN